LLADYAGPCHFARVNGVMSTYVVAARAAGPLIAVLALTAFGSHGAILIGAALLMLVSAYALHRAVGRSARPRRSPGERIHRQADHGLEGEGRAPTHAGCWSSA
jgi:membrane protein implicated in regulation of membrane protease activity